MPNLNVLILAGGYGTRLKAVAKDTPKALLQVNHKPILEHILDRVAVIDDVQKVCVVTNDKFYRHFCDWQKQYNEQNLSIEIFNDGTTSNEDRLGSIGDMDFVWDQMKDKIDCLVIGGDNLFDFDLASFCRFAQSRRPAVSAGVYDIEDIAGATKFGVVELDDSKKIISFEEKPEKPKSSLITMCLYFFPLETQNQVKLYRAEQNSLDAAGGFIRWLALKNDVYGFHFTGKWYDIGSIESLQDAQKHFTV